MIETAYANTLLGELADTLGLVELALDSRGSAAFVVDDGAIRIDLQLRPGLGALDLTAWPEPIEMSPARLKAMLAASFCWRDMQGAAFAVEPISGEAVLQLRCFEHDLAHGGLAAAVERLVRQARAWPKHLASIDDSTAAAYGRGKTANGALRA